MKDVAMHFDRNSLEDMQEMSKMINFLLLRGYNFSVERTSSSAPISQLIVKDWDESIEAVDLLCEL